MTLFKERWALTPEAEEAIQRLHEEYDMDTDLALSLIVRVWPEELVFDLERAS